MKPLVSVIIPTYNRSRLLVEAVESVLAQTYQDFEIIVVDDGSTDDTRQVIAPYVRRDKDRFRYVYQSNQGLSAARNTGCREGRGRYVAFLDSDDLWKPQKLAVQVPLLNADPSVGLVSSRAEVINESNTTVLWIKPRRPAGTTLRSMVTQRTQPPSSFLVRREAIDAIGGFDPEIKQGLEDVDLCFRLAARGWRFVCLDQPLIRYRVHESNITWDPIGTYQGYVRTYEKLLALPNTDIPRLAARRCLARYLYLLGVARRARGERGMARQDITRAMRLWPFVGWLLQDEDGRWALRVLDLAKSCGVLLSVWCIRPRPTFHAKPREAEAGMGGTLRSRTVSGLRWTLINSVGEKALSFGTMVVLARILDPEHFGLYALAFVAIDSFGIFKNLGLDAAIIQRQDRIEEAADTAVLILPLIGTSLWGLLYLTAPTVAVWMGNPQVGRVIQVLGTSLILMSLGNVPWALIQKSMRFHIRAAANLTGMAACSVIAITLALRGWDVWSLVVGYLVRCAISVAIQWAMLGWVPRWRFDWTLLKEMLHFSKYVVGAWIIGFLAINVDKIAIGRWLGTTALGYYTLCLGLSNLITTQLNERIYQVAFPAFAEAQGASTVLRNGFVKLIKYLLMCALPVAVLLVLAPTELLWVIYGKRWVVAAPILQILAISGALQSVRAGIEPALLGCGRSRTVFALNALQLALLSVGSVTMGMARSMVGVAWALVIAAGVTCVTGLSVMMRQVGVRPMELARELRPVGASIAVMAVTIMLARLGRDACGLLANLPWAWLLGLVAASGVAYLVGIFRWDRPVIHELLHLLRLRLPSVVRGS